MAALGQTFSHAIELIFFITLPAMAGLMVLRAPIVAVLFQHGAFDDQAVRLTANALLYYGMGLWSFAAVRVVLNLFFALKDTRTPLWAAGISVMANIGLGLILMGPLGHGGLALALSLASMIYLGVLVGVLKHKMRGDGAPGWRGMAISIGRSALCAAVMATVVWSASLVLLPAQGGSRIAAAAGLLGCIVLGMAVFGTAAYVLRAPEVKEVTAMLVKGSEGK